MSRPDVLVIGAGVIGAFCAWELAREGLRVEILESSTIGGGATAEGMGHLVVMDDSPAQLALTSYSRALWQDLRPRLDKSCEYSPCGTLWLARDPADLEALEHKATRYRLHGIDYQWLGADDLRRVEPALSPGLVGALRVPGDALVYPPVVAQTLIAAAQERFHLKVRLGETIHRVESDASTATVKTASGLTLQASWAINAAGRHALHLLPNPLPRLSIQPRKGHLVITDRQPGFCRHQLVEAGYLKSAHSHRSSSVAFNLQPRPNGQLLLGSSRQYGETSRRVERAILKRMIDRADSFVPALRQVPALRVWTGFRAATEDHLPILGPVPRSPRVLLSAGHEGLGITNAPGCARLLADHILGRRPALPLSPYAAERGRSLMEATHG